MIKRYLRKLKHRGDTLLTRNSHTNKQVKIALLIRALVPPIVGQMFAYAVAVR